MAAFVLDDFEYLFLTVIFSAMSFPNKEDRAKCWDARDKYWSCLDNTKGEKKDSVCTEFRKVYEQSCPAQWVKHFDRKKDYLVFKEQIGKQGYEPLSEEK